MLGWGAEAAQRLTHARAPLASLPVRAPTFSDMSDESRPAPSRAPCMQRRSDSVCGRGGSHGALEEATGAVGGGGAWLPS
jgi:hypothetical protein